MTNQPTLRTKPTLKTRTIKLIDVYDWDYFVRQVYEKPYMYQQQDGCKERRLDTFSVPAPYGEDFEATEIPFEVNGDEMGVSFETWLNTSPESTLERFANDYSPESCNTLFWARNFYPSVEMIINDLHAKGLLEEGKYGIKIDW